jgi:hypothetical protein
MTYVNIAQYVIAAGLVGYGVFVGVQKLGGRFGRRRDRTPVDDLRLVIDLAARLRDQGKTSAVSVCQQLLDELLKPETTKS